MSTANTQATLPDEMGRFGEFGGRFVPETLMSAIEELEREYAASQTDEAFLAEMRLLLEHYVGRPTPLYYAENLSAELGGAQIYIKREDLAHTGAHKINNALGQALLAKRMGKNRIIAETGGGAARGRHGDGVRDAQAGVHRIYGRGRTSAGRRSTYSACGCWARRCARCRRGVGR